MPGGEDEMNGDTFESRGSKGEDDGGGGGEQNNSLVPELELSNPKNARVRQIKSTVKTKIMSSLFNRSQFRIKKKRAR